MLPNVVPAHVLSFQRAKNVSLDTCAVGVALLQRGATTPMCLNTEKTQERVGQIPLEYGWMSLARD